jgi:asparagine synthase (glutamine-hydrolysing)
VPGLFGIASAAVRSEQLSLINERIRSLLNIHRTKERFVDGALIGSPFLLGYHSIRQLTFQKGIAQSGPIRMAFDGILFEPSPPDIGQLLSQYCRYGPDIVQYLRGYFALAVCNEQTGDLYLYTDQAATHPIYYAVCDGLLYFAGDYPTLSAILPDAKTTNSQAVVDMLTFGYMTGDKTPRKLIKCMPSGSCLCWNAYTATLKIKPYFVVDNTFLDSDSYAEMRDKLQFLFVQAVERTLQNTKPLFTLSGGLDSRAILGTAVQFGISKPDCLTFGEPTSLDVKLAVQVARKYKAQMNLISLGDGDYLADTFAIASHYNGGMVYYSGSAHMLYALQQLDPERWDIVQTGISGDMLMGSFLHKAELDESVDTPESLTERIITQLGQLTWIERLVADEVVAQRLVYDSVRDSLTKIDPEKTMSQALELWNLHNRQQRAMLNGFRMIENFAEYVSPFFDVDLYSFVLRIPHRYRLGEAIYMDMLSHLLPSSVWRIPWQKTGHPPSTHRWINKVNAWNTLWLGRAKQVVFPSKERERSMNPMGIWLRDNARLRRFAVEQLLAWDPVPYPLDQAKVHKFAQDIATGRIGVTRRTPTLLFRLLTLCTWKEEYGG